MREDRKSELNGRAERPGAYVLYWMQAALRSESNSALDWAVQRADELDLPVLVVFCLVADYPGASKLQYRFMLDGLAETGAGLADKGIRLVLRRGNPADLVPKLAKNAALLVTDSGYLRHQRAWLAGVAGAVPCRCVRLEGDVTVPPRLASPKEEWSAYTLRRKLRGLVDFFLEAPEDAVPRRSSLGIEAPAAETGFFSLPTSELPGSVPARMAEQVPADRPGRTAALRRFRSFLDKSLDRYAEDRNDPTLDGSSRMSAALHFGFVSPVELVRGVLDASGQRSAAACSHPGAAAFIEELTVRRELALNMAERRDDYDRYSCIPDWARKTLAEGALHPREERYGFEDLEYARTSDPYWNAAQDQMVLTGRMHGYMRMYWGKRILAWTASPEEAYAAAVRLNDQYSLDGRDAGGYAGIAWCFGKHDRPWTGRPIYGTVRFMNSGGLKRKFDADLYAYRIQRMKED